MKKYVASCFAFTAGISSGVFASLMMNDTEKLAALNYFNRYLSANTADHSIYTEVFFYSARNNMLLLLIIGVAGFFTYAMFLCYGALIFKGIALGFSAAFLLEGLHSEGAALILLTVVPQNLILISTLIIAVSSAPKKSLGKSPGSYVRFFLVLSMPILAGCLIEAFLAPALTQLIISQ